MSTTKRWTCEEDAKLMASHRKGRSIGDIARRHNRSHGAIRDRLAKHLFHIEHPKKCGGLTVTREDADHLSFIYERMAHVHGENQQVDYMLRFRKIIATMKTVL